MARPDSIPEARRAMREALGTLAKSHQATPCKDRPIPYTDVRQTPDEAEALCEGCPVKKVCYPLGYTESVYADDMVYGGVPWRRGRPVLREDELQERRSRDEKKRNTTATTTRNSVEAKGRMDELPRTAIALSGG